MDHQVPIKVEGVRSLVALISLGQSSLLASVGPLSSLGDLGFWEILGRRKWRHEGLVLETSR